ncbi:MAG TPA: ferredoxin [Spirochaetia bacterium]|nr:MAG: ferredoxin [Spirochaetes bacterium GWB1_36_13]HCL57021.1 ferredoxin [Spirochaetia bacterium]
MHVISDSCVSCGACEPVCPVQAIAPGSGKYDISSSCIDCGACVSVCPVSAISAG